MNGNDSQIKKTHVQLYVDNRQETKLGVVEVSTIFTGINTNPIGKPILFETMVFGGELDEQSDRCATYEAALKMHELMLEKVHASIKAIKL